MQNDTPPPLFLRRIEPVLNMHRFYVLTLHTTLFGEVSLTRHWGRIGTRGQIKTQTFTERDVAQRIFERLARSKRRRGYLDTRSGA